MCTIFSFLIKGGTKGVPCDAEYKERKAGDYLDWGMIDML